MRFLTQKNRAEKNICQRYSILSARFLTHNQKGFSIIEVLIYVSILIMMTAIIIQVMAGTFSIFTKAKSLRSLTSAGSSITERISYNVRNAKSFTVTGNNFGVNPGTLSITVPDQNGVDHTYYYAKDVNNKLTETIDAASAVTLHGNGITVSTFQIVEITAGIYKGALITLTLSDNRISPAQTATFTTTIMMRGSY